MMELNEMSMAELGVRFWLGNELLRWIRTDNNDDPRAPAAIARMEEQVRALNAEIVRRKRLDRERMGTAEPEPVTVSVKALHLTARRH